SPEIRPLQLSPTSARGRHRSLPAQPHDRAHRNRDRGDEQCTLGRLHQTRESTDRLQTAKRGSPRCATGVRRSTTGSANAPARPKYSATIAQCPSSLEYSHPRIALVGKHRFENVHTKSPPVRRTRATSRNTAIGYTR